jgi:hypothetical protein
MVAPQRIACLDKNHETLFFSYSNASNSQPLHESHTPLLGALIPLLLSSISVRRYAVFATRPASICGIGTRFLAPFFAGTDEESRAARVQSISLVP